VGFFQYLKQTDSGVWSEKGYIEVHTTLLPTHKAAELHALCKDLPDGGEDENLRVSISGRIMLRRVFGKLAFFHLQDESGQIQLYIDKARLAADSFDQLKALTDAGDIIGVKGTMKRTDKVG
jgi:lysyl-tRNA synthetase class 2